MNNDYDYIFKIILVGDSGVGKSSMLTRFVDEAYCNVFMSTIGVDFKIKTLNIDNKICKIQVWDTAGQEKYKSITNVYYRGAQACIIVYDVTDRMSFQNVYNWIQDLETHAADDIYMLLVGNKSDLSSQRAVTELEGYQFANNMNILFTETSANNNININVAFETVARNLKKNQKNDLHSKHTEAKMDSYKIDYTKQKKNEKCC